MNFSSRVVLVAAFALAACSPPTSTCRSDTDCTGGQTCQASKCAAPIGGGGGTTGGGTTGGGTGGGTTGGGTTGGGTGGGTTGGGTTGGGTTGGGTTGGGTTGGGTGGGVTGTGESCADPFVVSGATNVLTNTTVDAGNDLVFTDSSSMNCQGSATVTSNAPDHVYKVTVPAGQRVVASLESPDFDAIINIVPNLASCGSANPDGGSDTVGVVCAAGADDPEPSTIKFKNTGAGPVEAYVLVDGYSSGEGDYTLSLDIGPTPAGDDCDAPTPLVSGTPLTAQSIQAGSGFANDYSQTGTNCTSSSDGIDRAYALSVPAGQRASISVTPGTGFDTTVSLAVDAAACASRTCIASSDNGGTAAADTIQWTNADSVTRTLLVIVDSDEAAGGTFDISATVAPVPAGDVCGNIAAPTPAGTLTGESFATFASDWDSLTTDMGCAFGDGPDRVYSVSVPANQRLTVNATSASVNLALSLVEGAAAACASDPIVCASSANQNFSTGAESLTFDNFTGAAKSVFVIVDRVGGTPMPDIFDLTLSFGPTPYFPSLNNISLFLVPHYEATAQSTSLSSLLYLTHRPGQLLTSLTWSGPHEVLNDPSLASSFTSALT